MIFVNFLLGSPRLLSPVFTDQLEHGECNSLGMSSCSFVDSRTVLGLIAAKLKSYWHKKMEILDVYCALYDLST